MIARNIQPAPELRDYIFRYRIRHFHFDGTNSASLKPFPPRPEQCIIFYPRGAETIEYPSSSIKVQRPRSIIAGQFTERINRLITTPEFLMISVEFRPGALFRLTGINFAELVNKCEDAEAVLSPELAAINSRLSGASTYEEMILIIEEYFKALVVKSSRPLIAADSILNELINSGEILSVDQLSKKAYLSPRQLERKVMERIGVCPKTFLKLSRFHKSLLLRLAHPERSWFSIAIESGYNDYQHLVKEYKTYTLNTPNLFITEEFRSPGRVLGLTK
jgi:AraC-like DNA-binding protein